MRLRSFLRFSRIHLCWNCCGYGQHQNLRVGWGVHIKNLELERRSDSWWPKYHLPHVVYSLLEAGIPKSLWRYVITATYWRSSKVHRHWNMLFISPPCVVLPNYHITSLKGSSLTNHICSQCMVGKHILLLQHQPQHWGYTVQGCTLLCRWYL